MELLHDFPVVEMIPQPPLPFESLVGRIQHAGPCVQLDNAGISTMLRRFIPYAIQMSVIPFRLCEKIDRQTGIKEGSRLDASARDWSADRPLGQRPAQGRPDSVRRSERLLCLPL